MSKKTSGTDDLIKTLIKQHGLAKAIDRARQQWQTLTGYRMILWGTVYHRLKDLR